MTTRTLPLPIGQPECTWHRIRCESSAGEWRSQLSQASVTAGDWRWIPSRRHRARAACRSTACSSQPVTPQVGCTSPVRAQGDANLQWWEATHSAAGFRRRASPEMLSELSSENRAAARVRNLSRAAHHATYTDAGDAKSRSASGKWPLARQCVRPLASSHVPS
jgi:hypothetical protein